MPPSVSPAAPSKNTRRPRVLHFVTGGFSGATQVALDLVEAHLASGRFEPLLVLRRKRQTPQDRVDALRARGVPLHVVPGWSHAATLWELVRLCRRFRPDILVAHGFSDHIWGRLAGLLAGVPHLVHVEHNSRERYTRWRLAQSRWLAARTDLIVGCSEGVRSALLDRGFPADRTVAIPNGIRLERFDPADRHPWAERRQAAVMAARFARQKDHATLLHAVALLKQRGIHLPVTFAGGGKSSHREAAMALARSLDLEDRVTFLGHCPDVPGLLMDHRICVLSTHYEGMPLSLVEGMAAGCMPVASDVVGVRELISPGLDGDLVPESSPQALADSLQRIVEHPEAAARAAQQARRHALERHGLPLMTQRYEDAFERLLHPAAR
ncbi:glycosyltransferase [Comamonas sp. BIGb0124]|uniref:glycosyltransferase n=1 Tax=Comamonas sp. BIGb0124 TaxID=2485130 RepID=UPI000F4A02E2|nr:glycosyltransferase [Comamonas sp. BIGb0124]